MWKLSAGLKQFLMQIYKGKKIVSQIANICGFYLCVIRAIYVHVMVYNMYHLK